MFQYRVFNVSPSGRRYILRERLGVFHVALAPRAEAPLTRLVRGGPADVGPCRFYDPATGWTFAICIERARCSLEEALESLQETDSEPVDRVAIAASERYPFSHGS